MKIFYFALSLLFLPLSAVSAQTILDNAGAYIEIQAQGSGGTIRMGQTGELGKFRLSNRSGKNIILNRLKLRNYGSAKFSEAFENLTVQNNGQIITSNVIAGRNDLTFQFDEALIGRGDSLVLSVVGRLIYAQSGDTVELGIRRDEDVSASILGLDYFSLECRDCASVRTNVKQLRPGGIYIRSTSPYRSARYYGSSRRTYASTYRTPTALPTSTSPSSTSRYYYRPSGNQTYSPGSKDIRFFNTYINSKVGTHVEGLFLGLGSGSTASDKNGNGQSNDSEDFSASFSDFNLYVNLNQVDSTNEFVIRNEKVGLEFDSSFDIPANAQILLTGRISNQAINGDKIKFSLSKNGLIDPVYLYNGDSVNQSSINGGSSSQFNTTGTAPLSISK